MIENREYDKSCCLVVLRGEREGKSLFFFTSTISINRVHTEQMISFQMKYFRRTGGHAFVIMASCLKYLYSL